MEHAKTISEGAAAVLAHPVRRAILEAWNQPSSATEIAGQLGIARQKVNYHARALAEHGFLESAGRRRKRNMWEQRYVRSEKLFVLSPEILGPLAPVADAIADHASAAYAVALATRTQAEVSRLAEEGDSAGKRLPLLFLDAEVAFASAADRAAFAGELQAAVSALVARYSSPDATRRRTYRLALSIYPRPKERKEPAI